MNRLGSINIYYPAKNEHEVYKLGIRDARFEGASTHCLLLSQLDFKGCSAVSSVFAHGRQVKVYGSLSALSGRG